jgi:Flp pilus assembly protein TadD
LARAAKARESDGGQAAQGMQAYKSRRRGGGARRTLIILLVLIVSIGAVYVLYGDEIADTVNVIVFGEPTPPPPEVPKKPNPEKLQPGFAQNQAPAATDSSAASAPASPPAANNAADSEPPAPAAAPAPTTVTVTVATSSPSAPPAPAAPTVVAAAAPSPSAPAVAPTPPVPRAPDSAPQTMSPRAPAAPAAPQQTRVAAVTSEQDLPAILDNIRQQRTKASLQPSAVVDRTRQVAQSSTGAADADTSGVKGMVSVESQPEQQRDDVERAYDMLVHGQYEGALQLYDGVLKTAPDSVAALLGKAIALHKLRRAAEARGFYQRVLAIDPSNREALTNVLSIVAAQAPAAALAELRDMQKTNPAFSPIPAQIAQIDAQTGNFADAIASYNRAIQLSPDNALYRLNLAIVQDRAGLAHDAAASYQTALDRLGSGVQLPIPIESIRTRLRYLQSR